MGMDANGICSIFRLYADVILSRLFRKFLRRQALCNEGRFSPYRRVYVEAFIPELVPAQLPVRVRNIPLRRGLTTSKVRGRHAYSFPSHQARLGVRAMRSRRSDQRRTEGTALEIFVRRGGLITVRDHLRPPGVRPDARRFTIAGEIRRRDRGSLALPH